MPGFGFGVEPAGNHTEVAWQFQTQGTNANRFIQQPVGATGIAVAPFHLAVEIGYLITPKLLALDLRPLPVRHRRQRRDGARRPAWTSGATTKAFGAVAVLARARYRFLEGRFHPYIHVDIGGGEIRHVLDISSAEIGRRTRSSTSSPPTPATRRPT